MKKKKQIWITLCSTLAFIILACFQLNWILQAQELREKQFHQQVSLALSFAVNDLANNENMSRALKNCVSKNNVQCEPQQLETITESIEFERTLTSALRFYGIDLPYHFDLAPEHHYADQASYYQCSLKPVTEVDELAVSIRFPKKQDYIYGQMSFMLISCILILIFVAACLFYANLALWNQKRLMEQTQSFFNNLAHEFKTPLTNISLATRMIERTKTEKPELLSVIKSENSKLISQLEKVLQLARMEEENPDMVFAEVSIGALILKVVNTMQLRVKDEGGEITYKDYTNGTSIYGDEGHLHNVFTNLIDNAVKYCEKSPEIYIECNLIKKGAEIVVSDNGLGISPENQELIFKKFHRVHTGDVHNAKGFGLGLTYVKTVIDSHSGDIKLESKPGSGSRFILFLPFNPLYHDN